MTPNPNPDQVHPELADLSMPAKLLQNAMTAVAA